MGLNFGYGFSRLLDAGQRVMRCGEPVYLRIRNTPGDLQSQPYANLGFSITGSVSGGTQDILIDPPPSYQEVSWHNIGQSMGVLRYGARVFSISANWVRSMVASGQFPDEDHVWNSPQVVGLVTEGLLFSIVSPVHDILGGLIVNWQITCNANEVR